MNVEKKDKPKTLLKKNLTQQYSKESRTSGQKKKTTHVLLGLAAKHDFLGYFNFCYYPRPSGM